MHPGIAALLILFPKKPAAKAHFRQNSFTIVEHAGFKFFHNKLD
jgi:hypothetical protein